MVLCAPFHGTGAQLGAWALQLQQTLRAEHGTERKMSSHPGNEPRFCGQGLKLQLHVLSHLTAQRWPSRPCYPHGLREKEGEAGVKTP